VDLGDFFIWIFCGVAGMKFRRPSEITPAGLILRFNPSENPAKSQFVK
jgi:hypothetical protein